MSRTTDLVSSFWNGHETQRGITPQPTSAAFLLQKCIEKYGWLPSYATRILKCYRQFLELKQVLEDWSGTLLTPPRPVDLLWMEHMLNNRHNYNSFCYAFCGHILLRVPLSTFEQTEQKIVIDRTKTALKARFGSEMDSEVWEIFGGCQYAMHQLLPFPLDSNPQTAPSGQTCTEKTSTGTAESQPRQETASEVWNMRQKEEHKPIVRTKAVRGRTMASAGSTKKEKSKVDAQHLAGNNIPPAPLRIHISTSENAKKRSVPEAPEQNKRIKLQIRKNNQTKSPEYIWMPKQAPVQLSDGTYRKPRGAPPKGYVWDPSLGVYTSKSEPQQSSKPRLKLKLPTARAKTTTPKASKNHSTDTLMPYLIPTQLSDGSYLQPSGAPPNGYVWDPCLGVYTSSSSSSSKSEPHQSSKPRLKLKLSSCSHNETPVSSTQVSPTPLRDDTYRKPRESCEWAQRSSRRQRTVPVRYREVGEVPRHRLMNDPAIPKDAYPSAG